MALGLGLLSFLLAAGFDDFFGQGLGDAGVAGHFHREGGHALAHGADDGGVAEHLGQGHLGLDDGEGLAVLGGVDHAAAAVEVADDGALVFQGRLDLDLHDRLLEARAWRF